MIYASNKIILLLTAGTVCTVIYVWMNGSKSFNEVPHIESVSTTIHNNNNTGNNSPSLKKKRFPNVIIIGSKKSGTTILREYLHSHPLIEGPAIEINFFNKHFESGVTWYINQMPLTTENELTLEKTPAYFINTSTPKRLHDLSKNVKLILTVRHPITRAVSDYFNWLRRKPKLARKQNKNSFEHMVFNTRGAIITDVSPIHVSMYDIHYQRWLKWFDKKQILVVNGEELTTNPVSVLEKIETFLNISHYFKKSMFIMNEEKGYFCWKNNSERNRTRCLSKIRGQHHPSLSNSTWNKLRDFFKPHIEKFCHLAAVQYEWCSL